MLIEVMVLSSRQLFLLLVIIPRLRPGLLSLTLGTGFQPALNSMLVVCNKFCLEDNTERSESNP